MQIIHFSSERAQVIEQFDSVRASAVHIGDGAGEAHVYCVRFDAGGMIGPHPAGFGQLFLVVAGAGWVSGPDGERVEVSVGHGAFFRRGELHAKGSERGMTAIMVQVHDVEPTISVQ